MPSEIMSIRQLCKQSKRPSNALFYFWEEQKTGNVPTRIITEKQLDLTAGMVVTVNWDGEIVEAEILALDGKSSVLIHVLPSLNDIDFFLLDSVNVLNAKDLEWSKQHLPAATVPELENAEEKDATVAEPAIEPKKKKQLHALNS